MISYTMVPCITCRDGGDIKHSMVFTQWFLVSPAEIEETYGTRFFTQWFLVSPTEMEET